MPAKKPIKRRIAVSHRKLIIIRKLAKEYSCCKLRISPQKKRSEVIGEARD
jgi:hypothetical protein